MSLKRWLMDIHQMHCDNWDWLLMWLLLVDNSWNAHARNDIDRS